MSLTRLALVATLPVALSCSLLTSQGSPQIQSISALGVAGQPSSAIPAITPDGRYVAFTSTATNLVPGDNNSRGDVFVRDRLTGAIEIVSVASNGAQADRDSYWPTISDDGRYVAFISFATNLGPDANILRDGFVHDRQTGQTTCVTLGIGGVAATSYTDIVRISGDGSAVVWTTSSTNIINNDTNFASDVFVRTLANGAVQRVSLTDFGTQISGGSFVGSISGDGMRVSFHSSAGGIVPGDTNGQRDIFVRDLNDGWTQRVSVSSTGTQSTDTSWFSTISGNGRFVTYHSASPNLVPNDTNGAWDVFVHDLLTATTERVSVSSAGGQGTGSTPMPDMVPQISRDGRYVAFATELSGLVSDDSNGFRDAFVHDRQLARTVMVSRAPDGTPANSVSAVSSLNGTAATMAVSVSPPVVVFDCHATNLYPSAPGGPKIFTVDLGLSIDTPPTVPLGGTATVQLEAPAYPTSVFLHCFGTSSNTGFLLPGLAYMPLDNSPILFATLGFVISDTNGSGSWSLPIPSLPALSGQFFDTVGLMFDLTAPALFPAVTNTQRITIL